MSEKSTIPEFYKEKTVFITGGTGFIGKVLIEKLLRSCPEIRTIYILIRPKKGQNPEERIRKITNLPLFDRLKTEYPENLKKIQPILGDVNELGLGLKPGDRQVLIDQVNIIFHCAASVRFDDPLNVAIIANVRGTRELINLGLEMKNLISFMHISTTYCHVDKKIVEEKMYPALADWKKAIEIAEESDQHILNVLSMKFMGALPNTYTFTKNLAESLVYDLCNGRISTTIIRPSIVISTANEPIPGWIDNFNGPVGVTIGVGKGILRSVWCRHEINVDYITVDMFVKGLILVPWWKQTICNPERRLQVEVCNASNNDIISMTLGDTFEMFETYNFKYPLNEILWYPNCTANASWYSYYIRTIIYQLIPAFFVDIILKLYGSKFRLMRIQQKIYTAGKVLSYFWANEWKFINNKLLALDKLILTSDCKDFSFDYQNFDVFTYLQNASIGAQKYLLKVKNYDLDIVRRNTIQMWLLSIIFNLFVYLMVFWLIFIKFDLLSIF